jgi:hypothetical protein
MPHFASFNNISAQFDSLINDNQCAEVRIPVSSKHHISASISRIGLFKTGGISVDLVSISKSGALFNTSHHSLLKSSGKDMSIELMLNGRCFEYEAHIVRQDAINNLYGIKFTQPIKAVDAYLASLNTQPHYGLNMPLTSSVWLDLEPA